MGSGLQLHGFEFWLHPLAIFDLGQVTSPLGPPQLPHLSHVSGYILATVTETRNNNDLTCNFISVQGRPGFMFFHPWVLRCSHRVHVPAQGKGRRARKTEAAHTPEIRTCVQVDGNAAFIPGGLVLS